MPVLTKQPSMGDVLKYEANPNYTREVVTLLQGMPYPVGSVLGQITASCKYKLATATGSYGAQTASAVLLCAGDALSDYLEGADDVAAMITEVDKDGDGCIDYEEFVALFVAKEEELTIAPLRR